MDKRLVYDPNVDLSSYNMNPQYSNYQEPMSNLSSSSKMMSNIQPMAQQMPQQIPQIPQMPQQIPPQYMSQQYMNPPVNYSMERMDNKKKTSNSKSNTKSKLGDICSMSSLRKLLVITVLYVVLSHNKTSLLLCNNIPYICITNALAYNTLKGIIMALVIVLTWNFM